MKAKQNKPKTTSNVASIVTEYLNSSPKSQIEIAKNMGFDRPNILSMYKSGLSRVAYDRVLDLCHETGGDPERLFLAMIEEYNPELLTIIERVKGVAISEFDRALLQEVRSIKSSMERGIQDEMRKRELNYADKSRTRDFRYQLNTSRQSIDGLAAYIANNMLTTKISDVG